MDELHGSAFSEMDGGGQQWHIQRVEGEADSDQPLPQRITFQVKWLRLD